MLLLLQKANTSPTLATAINIYWSNQVDNQLSVLHHTKRYNFFNLETNHVVHFELSKYVQLLLFIVVQYAF